jgi:hypothetical protein
MSMIVLHLRWNDAGAEQHHRMLELLPEEPGLPGSGLFSRELRHRGRAILDVEVWGDEDAAQRFLDRLPAVSRAAGLEEPQVVAFCLPAMYAAVYARDAARLAAGAATPAIPAQRRAREDEAAPAPVPAARPPAG